MAFAQTASRELAYEVWDVFTSRALSGNPLGVFLDARGLTDELMLAITREMNFSECTFVFPRPAAKERVQGVLTRIFLKTEEIPFAGHPTLGTAMALWTTQPKRTDPAGQRLTLDLKAGPVPVEFSRGVTGVTGEMTQRDAEFLETHAAGRIAPMVGLREDELDTAAPIQSVSTGRPKTMVLVKSLAAIRRVRLDWAALERYFATEGARAGLGQRGLYFLTRETENAGAHFHARNPMKVGEDPVTGAAGGCAAAWFVRHGLAQPEQAVVIEQGSEIQRPGRMVVRAAKEGDRVVRVRVGGHAVRVMAGRLTL
jgi:trans-2,3-dihydro-3-hydroxyanthranilate isomerase